VHGSAAIQQDTYTLWASDGKYRVSAWFCNCPLRSHTDCWREMGDTVSVCGSVPMRQDHVHPAGGRWEIQSQCVVLHLSSKRTSCGREMGDTESVRGFATVLRGHVQTVGGRWETRSQCVVLQLSCEVTYKLLAGNGRYSVSVLFYLSSKITYILRAGDGRGQSQ
jgi:hypothetical protein